MQIKLSGLESCYAAAREKFTSIDRDIINIHWGKEARFAHTCALTHLQKLHNLYHGIKRTTGGQSCHCYRSVYLYPIPISPPQLKLLTLLGAGSGFGAAIAKQFAKEGAKVLVCDINADGGQKTVSEMSSHMSFHKMDVTKASDWKETIDAAVKQFGKVDILVNNAGTTYKNKPTVDVTEDEFQRVFDVNVKGIYLGCNAFIPQAIDRKEGGVIINIASVGATRPRPGLVWYNASKGAIWNVWCLNIFSRIFRIHYMFLQD